MSGRVRGLWRNLSQSLGFIPGLIVAGFAVLGIALVEIDAQIDLDGVEVVFKGDGSAARTVLSVIAGSLITVAGLTFSTTMVVLQLASSQFSPRILRSFFGDRLTQITIGTYVGTFVYAILVLRAVGSFGDTGFVPRLSVTVASLLGIAAIVLLIVFLHHVSKLVQVSHVTAKLAQSALARTDVLYPERYGAPAEDEEAEELLAAWHAEEAGQVLPSRPGFVQRVELDALMANLGDDAERISIVVCAGDLVATDMPIAETWPAAAAERWCGELRRAVTIADERDLDQDVGFGLRQLTDVALKAMSPGINDPMTAVTCIGYLRSILVRLAARAEPSRVRRADGRALTVVVRRRGFGEYLESLLQISRYVDGDAWVAGELILTLRACAEAADRCGASDRVRMARDAAATIAAQAAAQARSERDLRRIEAVAAGLPGG
jgi:uncharacterized membrane protein